MQPGCVRVVVPPAYTCVCPMQRLATPRAGGDAGQRTGWATALENSLTVSLKCTCGSQGL